MEQDEIHNHQGPIVSKVVIQLSTDNKMRLLRQEGADAPGYVLNVTFEMVQGFGPPTDTMIYEFGNSNQPPPGAFGSRGEPIDYPEHVYQGHSKS